MQSAVWGSAMAAGWPRFLLLWALGGALSLAGPAYAESFREVLASDDAAALEQWLAAEPSRVSVQDDAGALPLPLAARQGNLEAVVLLVEAGADLSLTGEEGKTALQWSILGGHGEITDYLLKQSGGQPARNAAGESALHWCARAGNAALCARLMKAGLSPLDKDSQGQTPLEVAISWGHFALLNSLLDNTVLPDAVAQTALSFDDDRIRYWSALYWAGRETLLLASLEQDLLAATPQPLAAYIWSSTLRRQRRLEGAYEAAEPALREALGLTPRIVMALDRDEASALQQFPVDASYQLSDVYALSELASVARDRQQYPAFFGYLEAGFALAPDHWQLVWMYENMKALDQPGMRERAAAFAARPEIRDTLTGEYLRALLPQHTWKYSDRLVFIERFLAAAPQDSRALVAQSLALNGNGYYPQAVEAQLSAIARFPFYARRQYAVEQLLKTGQHDRARRVSMGLAYWYGADNRQARGARYYAEGLMDEGDLGGAREVLETALAAAPEDGRLLIELARLELRDGHSELALAAAAKGAPLIDHLAEHHLATLLEAYRKTGDHAASIAAFRRYEPAIGDVSAGMLEGVLGDLEALGSKEDYRTLLNQALATYPGDAALSMREASARWAQGQRQPARNMLMAILPTSPGSERLLDTLYEYTAALQGEQAARQWAGALTARYPWKKAVWELAERSGAKTVPQMWQEAVSAAPTETFACEALVDHYVGEKEWDRAHGWARSCLQQQEEGAASRLSARQSLLLYDAWVYENQTRHQRLANAQVVAAEASFQEFLEGGGHYMDYLRYQESFCRARKDNRCAAQSLVARSTYQRDSTSHFHDLVARYSEELGANQTFGYGARMLARNPYDRDVVNSFLHKHLLWGGSPIVALKAIKDANARGLDIERSWERKALGQLGDSLSEFEQYTVEGKRPGTSLRYLQWFDAARRSALSADGTRVFYQLDGDMPGVEIVLPSGEQVIRRDHPVFGKPVYFSRGATFLELAYTPSGQLTRIADSSGSVIALHYNDDDEIRELISPEATLQFTYNPMGKPVRIVDVGVGELRVSYDDQGEILAVDSEQGHQMALRITRSFQTLLGMVNQVKRINDVKHLPQLSVDDPELDVLREDYEETEYLSAEEQKSGLALAAYLLAHVGDSARYVMEAEDVLYRAITAAHVHSDDKRFVIRGAEAVTLLHQLYRQVRPHGLPEETFDNWSSAYGWLRSAEQAKSRSKLRKALAAIGEEPITLLRDAHRLQRSDFSNTAYWHRYGNSELLGERLAGAEKQQVLLRENGDVVVATSQGLSVLTEGYWHWFGMDARTQRLSATVAPEEEDERANILALAETDDGVLWLGTARGLLALAGDYEGEVKRWSVAQGLPSARVQALAAHDDQVWVGTAKGLVRLQYGEGQPVPLAAMEGQSIEQVLRLPGSEAALLYRADETAWLWAGDQRTRLGRASSLAFDSGRMRAYRLDQDQVFANSLNDESGVWTLVDETPLLVAGKNDLLMAKRAHELSIWHLGEGEEALVVNTDRGINVLQGNYFEAMPLPFAEQRGGLPLGPRVSWSDEQGLVLFSEEGVYTRREGDSDRVTRDRVYDLLMSEAFDGVFMATGNSILILGNDMPVEAVFPYSSVNARVLAEDAEGRLISHDGYQVVRFAQDSDTPQVLFSARPSVEEEGWQGGIVDMLVDSRGTLWVVAGSSLFRYADQQVTEFNYLLDSKAFPSRSPLLVGVHETLDGGIEVVASNERHLAHQGVDLSGGLLRWNGNGFDNVGKPANWFVTGYTVLDERTALVGTNQDFARELAGEDSWQKRQAFPAMNDPSYQAVKEKNPLFWLGGEGSRFAGENTWLLPTAGGVVLYHGGTWLYPDRLNQLLPYDQARGQYGGRTVHDVAVAENGRVYVATDLGVLLYESRGVASLLNDNQYGQLAFLGGDTQQQQALSDIFLPALAKDSEQGQLLQRYQDMEQQIQELEAKLEHAGKAPLASPADSKHGDDAPAVARTENRDQAVRLRQELANKNRLRETLLARMEREHFGLYQMLKLDPREVAAMHQQLGEEQALVQYLPTPDKLLIQLVTREGAQIREVTVSHADLELVSELVVRGMRYRARHLEAGERGLSAPANPEQDAAQEVGQIDNHLAWLYDKLLRPVERELEGKSQVLVTPVGALTYLPFPALLRQPGTEDGQHREYAAQRFNIGVVPSLYHLSLVLQQNGSYSDGLTLVADPDGSLPGARQEVSRIAAESAGQPTVLEGAAATYANVAAAVRDARVVHLATHGSLDPAVPADSYLLLAEGYRLDVIDIAALQLDQTDLVVLSACETGIGKPGLEYATLARAFALAKVPTVVASYWKVDDGATASLMEAFYASMRDHPDSGFLEAMAAAQRSLIASGGRYADPAAWAAFTLFGKP